MVLVVGRRDYSLFTEGEKNYVVFSDFLVNFQKGLAGQRSFCAVDKSPRGALLKLVVEFVE